MSLLKPRIAAALPVVIADWRANILSPGETDFEVLGDVLRDFDRLWLDDFDSESGPGALELRAAYDLITDPANREFVDAVATELYA
jgi:hypothetical protein